jgi:peptidoglycan/LPS O-acetylase OafA/YrhL
MLGPKRSPRIALLLWIVAAAVAFVQPRYSDRLNVIGFAPCFVAGIVAYTLSGRYGRQAPALLWVPFLASVLCAFAVAQNFSDGGVYNRPLGWVFCLAIGLAIPLFHDSAAVAVNSAANHVARYSYGIYLFHCIALWVGCTVLDGLPEVAQWAIALSIVVVMSVGSYHLLEKPAIDFGARISKKWT